MILKAMGFRLDHLDYEDHQAPVVAPAPHEDDVTIEIRCGKAKIRSRLTASQQHCACPPKSENAQLANSFWEVQGNNPASSPGKKTVQDTSSNLLPDLSKKGILVTKHLLAIMMEVFRRERSTMASETGQDSGIPKSPTDLSSILHSKRSPSRMRKISVDYALLQTDDLFCPSATTTKAPPNTPRLPPVSQMESLTSPWNAAGSEQDRRRDLGIIHELTTIQARMNKVLLMLKLNVSEDVSATSPINLCKAKENESAAGPEQPSVNGSLVTSTPMPGSESRRASFGSIASNKSVCASVVAFNYCHACPLALLSQVSSLGWIRAWARRGSPLWPGTSRRWTRWPQPALK